MSSIIFERGMLPACVFQGVYLGEVGLSKQFVVDLVEMFNNPPPLFGKCHRLTQEAIAVDLFNGACSRETVTRACSGACVTPFDHVTSFAIIGALLLRDKIPLTPARSKHISRPKYLPVRYRQQVLELLYSYGVQCADGSCCGLVKDPISRMSLAV